MTYLTTGQVRACPFMILVPEHYRSDGTCKCDCSEHQKLMIAEWGYTEEDFQSRNLRP